MTAQVSTILYCEDLPTVPRPDLGPVLVTGATGYIGGRLVPELLARGYKVRAMVRAPSPEHRERWPAAEVVVADASDPVALQRAMDGVHTAYYLIHSLLLGPRQFEVQDMANVAAFRLAAERRGVGRIVYLGGLGDVRTELSPHLRSRAKVAEELKRSSIPTTVLRAAIIIGAGSASYEIIRHLVKNVPVFAIPYWSRTRCQPIAIRDVIRYLVGVHETPETAGGSFDVGGQDVLTYESMMRTLAKLMGRRRLFFHCPYSNIRFYAYLASLLTPVPTPVTLSLMEGLRNDELLLLRAEMILPGLAWLEFRIQDVHGRRRLTVKALYDTKTVWGRAYWYLFLPFHFYIFNNLIRQIERRSDGATQDGRTGKRG
jgi:uncharacterized protein YbjT (DUF2867 family)